MVFLNTVLCSFLNGLRVGSYGFVAGIVGWPPYSLASYCWLAKFGYPFLLTEQNKSWLVSANNDNPFLMASNWFRVVREPNSRQIKETSDRLFLEKFSSKLQGIMLGDMEPCWTFPRLDVMPGSVFQQWIMIIICTWQCRKIGRTWDLDNALEPLNQPAM